MVLAEAGMPIVVAAGIPMVVAADMPVVAGGGTVAGGVSAVVAADGVVVSSPEGALLQAARASMHAVAVSIFLKTMGI